MQTILLKARKLFTEMFCKGDCAPSKDELYTKITSSSWAPCNVKLIFSIYYLRDKVEEFYASSLAPFDVTSPQVEILKILYFSKNESVTQEDLRKFTFYSKANISSHLGKLEEKSLISRKENANNKRQKLVILTKPGEELFLNIAKHVDIFHCASDFLSHEETREFIKLANKVVHKVEEAKL